MAREQSTATTDDDVDLVPPEERALERVQSVEVVPVAEVMEHLLTGAPITPVDPGLVSEMIVLRMMACENVDEMMDPLGRQTQDKAYDVPVTLRSAIFMPSTLEDSSQAVFVVMDCVDHDGVPHMWSTGARGVVAQVAQLIVRRALPYRCKLIKVGEDTKTRSAPLYLQRV